VLLATNFIISFMTTMDGGEGERLGILLAPNVIKRNFIKLLWPARGRARVALKAKTEFEMSYKLAKICPSLL
jgi:hypothetical protein